MRKSALIAAAAAGLVGASMASAAVVDLAIWNTVGTYDSTTAGEGAGNAVDLQYPANSLASFQTAMAAAFAAGLGGVADFESRFGVVDAQNDTYSGEDGAVKNAFRYAGGAKTLTMDQAFRANTFGTDTAISGANSALARNATSTGDAIDLNFTNFVIAGGSPMERVVDFAITMIGRDATSVITVTGTFSDNTTQTLTSVSLGSGDQNDAFFRITAPAGKFITGVLVDQANTTRGKTFDDLAFVTAAIPEPASLSLLGLGGLAMLRRRR